MTFLATLVTSLSALFSTTTPAGVAPPAPVQALVAADAVDDAPSAAHAPVRVAKAADGAAAENAAPDVDAIVDRLQKTYESTTDFNARFTQRYTMMVLKKSQESTGTVVFAKPGKMRWDYATPTKKSFIVANGKLHVVQPEDNTALIDHCFKEDGLTASVSFLWGSGRIKEEFDVSPFTGTFGAKTDHHLLLVPKAKNSVFAKIILVVDPVSSRVKQSVVVDPQGNVNQFIFDDAKFNTGVKDTRFDVALPPSMAVSRMPGTCDPSLKR
jgi:outer membrane lipoprotein carrier protein